MCGRYTLTVDQEALSAALGVKMLLADHPTPRYNVAPTQEAPVLLRGGEIRRLRWGLVPSWAEDPSKGARLINARSETVATKPSFREAFRSGRCLVPADGYFEWVQAEDPSPGAPGAAGKTPWWIHAPGRDLFTFAGLHARWTPPGGGPAVETFTILTCDAVGEIARLHHRMPVIVPPELRAAWMPDADADAGAVADPGAGTNVDIVDLLEGARRAARSLGAHVVSRRVNRPANDDPALVDEMDPAEEEAPPTAGEARTAPPVQRSLFE